MCLIKFFTQITPRLRSKKQLYRRIAIEKLESRSLFAVADGMLSWSDDPTCSIDSALTTLDSEPAPYLNPTSDHAAIVSGTQSEGEGSLVQNRVTISILDRNIATNMVKIEYTVESINSTEVPTGYVRLLRYVILPGGQIGGEFYVAGGNVVDGKGTLEFSDIPSAKTGITLFYYRVGSDVNAMQDASSNSIDLLPINADYGDAPSSQQSGFPSDYPVLRSQNGAVHQIGSLYLGTGIGAETDGKPSQNADGDSSDDGIKFPFPIIVANVSTKGGIVLKWNKTASDPNSQGAMLDGWIDFNRDGDWDDSGERIFHRGVFVAGDDDFLSFDIPAGATPGKTAARFRLSNEFGLTPTGFAFNGEVEDYIVDLVSNTSPSLNIPVISWTWPLVLRLGREGTDFVIRGRSGEEMLKAPIETVLSSLEASFSTIAPLANFLKFGFTNLQLDGRFDLQFSLDTLRFDSLTPNQKIVATSSMPLVPPPFVNFTNIEIDFTHSEANTLDLSNYGSQRKASDGNLQAILDADDKLIPGKFLSKSRRIQDGKFVHTLARPDQAADFQTVELVTSVPYQNPIDRFDVDSDQSLQPIDILSCINVLSRIGVGPLPVPESSQLENWRYVDVNGDNEIGPLDVLVLINQLKRRSSSNSNVAGEGNPESENSQLTVRGNKSVNTTSSTMASAISGCSKLMMNDPFEIADRNFLDYLFPTQSENPSGIGSTFNRSATSMSLPEIADHIQDVIPSATALKSKIKISEDTDPLGIQLPSIVEE